MKCFTKNFLNKLILLLLFFQAATNILAQNPNPVLERLTTRDGLSHNRVIFIYQDKKGFMWISTPDGLNCYDGKTFKTFFHSESDSNSIADNNTGEIVEDQKGNLIIGTAKGISIYNPFENEFRNIALPVTKNINEKGAVSLNYDSNQRVWASSLYEVFEFDSNLTLVKRFDKELAGDLYIYHVREDKRKNTWIEKKGIMNMIDNKNKSIYNSTNNPGNRQLFNATLSSGFVFDREGNIWCIQKETELVKYSINGDEKERITLPSNFRFQRINVTASDKIWMSSQGEGVLMYDLKLKIFKKYLKSEGNPLSGLDIVHVTEDNFGNTWFATENGLEILPHTLCDFNLLLNGHDLFKNEKIDNPFGYFIVDTDKVWLNSWAKGIINLNLKTHAAYIYGTGKTGDDNCIWQMMKDKNEIWFGNFHGLHLFNIITHHVSDFDKSSNYPSFLDSTGVVGFFRDSNYHVWISLLGENGVLKYDSKTKLLTHFSPNVNGKLSFPMRHFNGIAQDNRGRLWMGYGRCDGLVLYDYKTNSFSMAMNNGKQIFNQNVECLLADGNFLWIGSVSGLYKMNLQTFELKKYSRSEGLVNDYIHTLALDSNQNLWIGTDGGLSVLETATNWIFNCTIENGLPENDINHIYYEPRDRHVYLLSDHYLYTTSVDSIRKQRAYVLPGITSCSVMGIKKSLSRDSTIFLDNTDKYFAFEFAAPYYPSAASIQYAYKMDGYDTTWINIGSRQIASFTHLPYGKYAFHLKSSLDGIHWNEMKKPLNIYIDAPFYFKQWFIILCIFLLIVFAVTAVVVYYRIKVNRLMIVQEVRNKIARDLHDDIGSSLSSISYMSEIAKQINKHYEVDEWFNRIGKSSRDIIENMNDIVWSVNPKNDNYESVLTRMRIFASSITEACNINLIFIADEKLDGKKLAMEERKNIYLIFKEIINNMVKHACCKNIAVHINYENGKMKLMIMDDGKGFDEGLNYNGNGLGNLKERARNIGATININSAPGKGSEFIILL